MNYLGLVVFAVVCSEIFAKLAGAANLIHSGNGNVRVRREAEAEVEILASSMGEYPTGESAVQENEPLALTAARLLVRVDSTLGIGEQTESGSISKNRCPQSYRSMQSSSAQETFRDTTDPQSLKVVTPGMGELKVYVNM